MGFISSLFSIAKSVVSTTTKIVNTAWKKTKEVAVEAVSWMADKAESFVAKVKETWAIVKPYIQKITPLLSKIANAVPIPWLKATILAIEKGLTALLMLENSPILKKVEEAINWAISLARKLKEAFFSEKETQEAQAHKEAFEEAAQHVQQGSEGAKAIQLAAMLNDYVLVQSAIKKIIDTDSIADFEHYLRLRATQKLLDSVEKTLSAAQHFDEISLDDIFLIKAGAKLLAEKPVLSDEEVIYLDNIIYDRHQKKLIPFVFEEMVIAWGHNLSELEHKWTNSNKEYSKEKVLHRRLETAKKLSELNSEEEEMLKELSISTPKLKSELDALAKRTREMSNYIFAAEGFLQVLEKTPEELEEEDKGYLAEEGGRVGMIIINCAQNGKTWEALDEEEQSLIIDFANIFEEESKKRVEKLTKIEVAA
ncbi:hypothetical protein WAE56_20975 [Iodobacter sp. LRB]|uniref:hypothetical protein n=1 Tax=unclassified Iodobacter TaxID=235634 RepID=UPI000C1064F0|nr:hypothetical protein [Iodobacter sp. BJB302]PHV01289.1 hypothetical protein CSQ88_13125 [Iodobacter sp. BJB302]